MFDGFSSLRRNWKRSGDWTKAGSLNKQSGNLGIRPGLCFSFYHEVNSWPWARPISELRSFLRLFSVLRSCDFRQPFTCDLSSQKMSQSPRISRIFSHRTPNPQTSLKAQPFWSGGAHLKKIRWELQNSPEKGRATSVQRMLFTAIGGVTGSWKHNHLSLNSESSVWAESDVWATLKSVC